MQYRTLHWTGDATGSLRMIDQTLLPGEFREIECWTAEGVWEAIKMLRIRGAPAIGVAAAYGVVIGTRDFRDAPRPEFNRKLSEVVKYLAGSRPTAVNLFWALNRMSELALQESTLSSVAIHDRLLEEAKHIHVQDRDMCTAIGQHGSSLIHDGMGVLTHCNAGALATGGDGTALSVIFAAAAAGKQVAVYADETRPLMQGARLTAWELQQRGIPVTVICDNMAAQVMKEGRVQAVITGADRIAANGDAANKIGTYGVALLAKAHDIPFYIAAPSSTFDLSLKSGESIPIEHRSRAEIAEGPGTVTVPEGVDVYNPAFDVTPASLITAFITERGIISRLDEDSIAQHLKDAAEA